MTYSGQRRRMRLVVTRVCAVLPLAALFAGCNNFWHDLILLPEEPKTVVDAAVPVIGEQPQGKDYLYHETVQDLTVSASASDGGQLTYRWCRNTVDSNTGGTAIDGASGAAYTPAGLIAGTPVYYYVVVTNTITDNGDGGTKSASVTSNTARILVSQVNAGTPTFSTQPSGGGVYPVGSSVTLAVTAEDTVSGGPKGTLTIRWYYNTTGSNADGTEVGTGVSCTPSTATAEDRWYYAELTNTIDDNGDGGTKSVSVKSGTVKVKVYTVTSVIVTPSFAGVGRDTKRSFSAVVNGDNQPPQGIRWSISGQTKAGTTINADTGELVVAKDERASWDITVTATSTADSRIYGTAIARTDIDFIGGTEDWGDGGTEDNGSAE